MKIKIVGEMWLDDEQFQAIVNHAIRESLRSEHGVASQTDLKQMEKRIMATQTEHAEKLGVLTEQVKKIGAETSKSLELIKALQEAQNNAGNTTPEVDAATEALAAQLGVVDDMVQDDL